MKSLTINRTVTARCVISSLMISLSIAVAIVVIGIFVETQTAPATAAVWVQPTEIDGSSVADLKPVLFIQERGDWQITLDFQILSELEMNEWLHVGRYVDCKVRLASTNGL